ncbi:hypothetical protein [Bailinhaonella thermotolerans]|uniref:Uncharacterized protein n=1 Tax=Bailinhaonella thermotolerans TaxID=1070861 RepID=A0A3A4BBF7_9ACTN|nr:hypothetical protein [Bailinhaonella thermotolerans]RJL35436.1 hypothetical protein D5H75_01065 [Bailinhaonella thermotolerans]
MTAPEDTGEERGGAEGLIVMPAFEGGGRVERTGIALVHEGEYIVPAPGSEAVLSPGAGADPDGRVVWSFPIEVEVVGELSDAQLDTVARHVFDELDVALRRQGGG